ncbi:hypothetical protein PtrM4_009140 [Pyrenophora tritici-repentis]|uniref:RNase H type-1 domain-containing protein n=1 Tax=Pyrenophora tritici-repentis TaxID=45151 RepID=A0A834S6X8_9PLEO|nr:hypothetical protein PtrM4_009140 [Pyrenophora tritici-repentis]
MPHHYQNRKDTDNANITSPISRTLQKEIATLFAKGEQLDIIFDTSKTELIHFTAKKERIERALILPNNDRIEHKDTVKWLAIYRLKNLSDNPGQHWQLRCLKAANTIRRKQANIHLLWAPRHTDIVGNERADYLAKEATKEDPRSTTKSIAYLGTTIKRIQQTEQRQEYKKYKARATALNKATYSAKYPLKISKTIQMPQNTKRVTSSAFYSLKLGHGYFNSYLKRFKKRDSNRCTCQNI